MLKKSGTENSRYAFAGFSDSVKTDIEHNLPGASYFLDHKN
jgi:hypothetical protein